MPARGRDAVPTRRGWRVAQGAKRRQAELAPASARKRLQLNARSTEPGDALSAHCETGCASWAASKDCCKYDRVLSERRRRFPQVLPDDEGGLRRETHRTAIDGDTSEHRQAAGEGMVDDPQKMLSELARLGARLIIQRAVEEEFDTWLGRARYERRPEAGPGKRNGFRPRHLQTAEGELRIEIPQAREAAMPFVSKLFRSGTASGC